DLQTALQKYQESLAIRSDLQKQHPEKRTYRRDLARSYGYMGDTQLKLGLQAEASQSYKKSEELRQTMVDENDSDIEAKYQLARGKGNWATLWEWSGEPRKAITAHRERLKYMESFAAAKVPAGFLTDKA